MSAIIQRFYHRTAAPEQDEVGPWLAEVAGSTLEFLI